MVASSAEALHKQAMETRSTTSWKLPAPRFIQELHQALNQNPNIHHFSYVTGPLLLSLALGVGAVRLSYLLAIPSAISLGASLWNAQRIKHPFSKDSSLDY